MYRVNRLIWGASGLVTAVALAVPGTRFMVTGDVVNQSSPSVSVVSAAATAVIPKPSAGLDVQSCDAPVQVVAQRVSQVEVTEPGTYPSGLSAAPGVPWSLNDGQLTVGDSSCDDNFQPSGFIVIVPEGIPVTVDSQGGNVTVTGTAGATVDSSDGLVVANAIDGPLTASTGGGNLSVHDLTGALYADTSDGTLVATDVTAPTATVITGGGNATISFATAPDTVVVSTDNGTADLFVPGGPYAVTDSPDSGMASVRIATNPAARRTITATTGGGNLLIAQ